MATRDTDQSSRPDPQPLDGEEGGGSVPVTPNPPRPRALQMISFAFGLVAVGAGFVGSESALFIFSILSVLANGLSLLFEGGRVAMARRTAHARA